MALFGEKYGDEVRVVTMGGDSTRFSVELCGGTHVRSTGDIGAFKILGESAVAAGVRRLEAITGQAVLDYLAQQEATLSAAAGTLKTTVAEVPARVAALVEERRRLERELLEARKALATGGGGSAPAAETVAGVSFVARRADGVPARELKGMVDQLKQDLNDGVVVVAAADETGKVSLVIGVTEALSQKVSAVELVRVGAEALGGKGGGGRPDMAQAGGADAAQIDAAFAAVRQKVAALAA